MTKDKTIFNAQIRPNSGSLNMIRMTGKFPANIFGLKKDSQTILLDSKLFNKHLITEGDSGLLYVSLDGEEQPVLIDEVQKNPLSGELLHVTLKRVNLKEKIVAAIPVELINEQEIKEATVLITAQEVEVEALPADLPDSIQIDASALTEIGQEIKWSQVMIDSSKIKLMLSDEELDQAVVLVQAVAEEKIEEPAEVAAEGEGAAETTADQAEDAGTEAAGSES